AMGPREQRGRSSGPGGVCESSYSVSVSRGRRTRGSAAGAAILVFRPSTHLQAAPVSFSRWLALPPIQPELAVGVKVAVLRVVADVRAHADHEAQPPALAALHDGEAVELPRRGYRE